jgi:hypothetical protein
MKSITIKHYDDNADSVFEMYSSLKGSVEKYCKLALFRALCDIALTSHHLAQWRQDGTVGIPMQDVAERWIFYYWPLLEDNSFFIPQIRGESNAGKLHIGFRPQLERLIDSFRHSGGLDGFAIALRNDS